MTVLTTALQTSHIQPSYGSKLHSFIVEKARNCPDDIAIISEDETLSYCQLLEKAQGISSYLLQNGIKAGDIVCVYLPRDAWLPSAILGVLWSGATYLPMDSSYPADRLTYMVNHCAPVAVITSNKLISSSSVHFGMAQTFCIESISSVRDYKCVEVMPNHCAYVIYTSGSTGNPKGVMVSHENLGHLIESIQEILSLSSDDRFFSLTPISFDIFGLELFLPVSYGACCILGSAYSRSNAELLMHSLEKNKATFIQATPTTYATLTQIGWQNNHLKGVLCGGEAWDIALAKKIIASLSESAKLWNMYGPTEATIWCAYQEITATDTEVLIGPPLKDNQFVLMNKDKPVEDEGELCVIGKNVALGYFGEPGKLTGFTNPPAFLSMPFYRTGDYVRCVGNKFRYISRIDRQIKLRGFRIELGEIETHIYSFPNVSQAAVVLKSLDENPYIEAFIVCDKTLSDKHIREHLSKSLPHYMIPQKMTLVDKLPLTLAGKIDYKKLSSELMQENLPAQEPEATSTKVNLEQIWRDLLKVDSIDDASQFIELGGHSLLAVQMLSRIRKLFSIKISLPEIFNNLMFADLCKLIESKQNTGEAVEKPVITRAESNLELKMTHEQIDNWKYQVELNGEQAVTTPTAILLEGNLSPDRLKKSWINVIEQDSIFSYQFENDKNQFLQTKGTFSAADTFSYIVSNEVDTDVNALVEKYINKHQGIFSNLGKSPFIKAILIKTDVNKYVFLTLTHHIIMDGWSKSLFFERLSECYREPDVQIKEKFKNLMTWESYLTEHFTWLESEQAKQQRLFWRNFLKPTTSSTILFPENTHSMNEHAFKGSVFYFQLQKNTVDQLNAFTVNMKATNFSVLLTVFYITLASFNHSQEQTIATVAFNRTDKKYESVIGLLANTLLIPAKISHVPLKSFVKQVHQNSLDALAHQELPFEEILESANISHLPGCNRPGNVMFLYQNIKTRLFDCGDDISSQFINLSTTNSIMDFLMEIRPQADGSLSGAIEFREQFCSLDQVKLFSNRFQRCLAKLLTDNVQDCLKFVVELNDAV